MNEAVLEERTIGGLHDFIVARILPVYARPPGRAVDLGCGSGALAVRLRQAGWDVVAVDIDAKAYKASIPFLQLDLNDPDFPSALPGKFDLVTAVEVIEHLESPIHFLRGVAQILAPTGIALVTTPNVENLPGRLWFLLTGKLRMLDGRGDPTHISPVFLDLLVRKWLPAAGLQLRARHPYPERGFIVSRPTVRWVLGAVAALLPASGLRGDCPVLLLERTDRS
jgi:2-polyprenyl-3-methyl-5-hydroxy-6-metoxy-1,4-benzoquinol methylase